VLASKFGADSSLLVSPEKTKLGWELELLEELAELEAPEEEDEDLRSIQGTATCLPEPCEELEEERPLELELPDDPEVLLLLLGDALLLLLGEDELLLGDDKLPLLEPEPESERTANSTRPEVGFMIVSLMVPI